MKTKDDNQLKKEVGKRFKQFRESSGKTQDRLAEELNVKQIIFTNIEKGLIYPGIEYLVYFSKIYRLNCNWLLSGEGSMTAAVSTLDYPIPTGDPGNARYEELMHYMQMPAIEQIILGRLQELKLIAKDEIEEFKKKNKREVSAKITRERL